MTVSGALQSLLTAQQLKVYAYAKADLTTSTAVVLPRSRKVLVIKRDGNPYKGMDSLPGGFLNAHLETLAKCAAREVTEECFFRRHAMPGESRFTYEVDETDVILVDVRSSPERDRRGHVIDHGFVYIVPEDKEAEVLANVSAGDDAKEGSARFEDLDAVLANPLAFDHSDLLSAVNQRLQPQA
jgi:ADP-ribose pyrophosphatase YjhB (NUDIX family)